MSMTPARLGATLACASPRLGKQNSDARTPKSIHARHLIVRPLCGRTIMPLTGFGSFPSCATLSGQTSENLPCTPPAAGTSNVPYTAGFTLRVARLRAVGGASMSVRGSPHESEVVDGPAGSGHAVDRRLRTAALDDGPAGWEKGRRCRAGCPGPFSPGRGDRPW